METELTFIEKVAWIQSKVSAPKSKKGGVPYATRNAEQILESAKPACLEQSIAITCDDELIEVGGRLFIKAKAMLIGSADEAVSATAVVELLDTTAMTNKAQASGATSSYARKYALQGVLALGNEDDADDARYIPSDPGFHTTYMDAPAKTLSGKATEKQIGLIEAKTNGMKAGNPAAYKEFGEWYKKELDNLPFKALTKAQASKVIDQLQPKEEETF